MISFWDTEFSLCETADQISSISAKWANPGLAVAQARTRIKPIFTLSASSEPESKLRSGEKHVWEESKLLIQHNYQER